MLEKIKNYFIFKLVDKYIKEENYDTALEKLNFLVLDGYKPAETYLKRGKLCCKLLMYDDAYNDFTYIITHCVDKINAYIERLKLNYELGNYYEVISDANAVLNTYPDSLEYKRYKFLAFVFMEQPELAESYIYNIFEQNKYKTIQFILKETALCASKDEYAKALKLLKVIDLIDPDNPIKIYNEANIYGLTGNQEKYSELIKSIDSIFPKYFISHFRFTDIYQERDLLETCFLLELQIFDKQNCFGYPLSILRGYKCYMEGKITESKEAFENAIKINPDKPEAYVLLGETYQLMSGYDNPAYKDLAEENYTKAMQIYQKENLTAKTEDMKRQIKHLNSNLSFR